MSLEQSCYNLCLNTCQYLDTYHRSCTQLPNKWRRMSKVSILELP